MYLLLSLHLTESDNILRCIKERYSNHKFIREPDVFNYNISVFHGKHYIMITPALSYKFYW